MKRIDLAIYFFLSFIVLSCGSEKNGKKKSKNKMTVFEIREDSLINKYNAVTIEDTFFSKYTFLFQDELISKKRYLESSGYISDVYKTDSNYVIEILNESNDNKYIINAIIDSIQMEEVKPVLLAEKYVRGSFILKVLKIKPVSPGLELQYDPGEPPSDDYDGSPPSISLDDFGNTRIFVFKASLVDYYLR